MLLPVRNILGTVALFVVMAAEVQALPSPGTNCATRGSSTIRPIHDQRKVLNRQKPHSLSEIQEQRLTLRGGAGISLSDVDWVSLLGSLFGGLTIFLYGIERLGTGIKAACGPQLKEVLLTLSYNRFVGFVSGFVACAITNSLSLVSVLLVEFVGSDLIALDNCMGVLLGACVGSTLIAFLVVLKVTKFGLLMVAMGYIMQAQKKQKVQQWGLTLFGGGLLFFSMDLMSSAFSFIKNNENFLKFLARLDDPLLAIIVSTALTGLIQSSGATMGILLSLSEQGMLGIKSATGLMLGANVGTCVTGLLASIGQPLDGLRLAVALLLFRVVAVIALFPFLDHFISFVAAVLKIKATSTDARSVTLYLAWSHTLFNVILSVGAMPFTKQWTSFIRYLLPEKKAEAEDKNAQKIRGKK